MCAWIADRLRNAVEEDTILKEDWEREGDIVALVEEVLGKQEELITNQWPKITHFTLAWIHWSTEFTFSRTTLCV